MGAGTRTWALAGLFCASGAAGLMYEAVWLRMLVRAFGSTTAATSGVLAVFMGGLAAGGWLMGRRAATSRRPLQLYGRLELALAAAAALSSLAAARLPELYSVLWPYPESSWPAAVLRLVLALAVLLPPTLIMGATLPLLSDLLARRKGDSGSGVAWLYGANTLGAVAGILFAGYAALGFWGETVTLVMAAALNAGVGLVVLALAPRWEEKPAAPSIEEAPGPDAARICGLMAVSGFCALGAEVLWTRLLVLLMGTSVYAFSAMLALYLLGLAAGSALGGWRLKRGGGGWGDFFLLQAAGAASLLLTFHFYQAIALSRIEFHYLYSPLRSTSDFLALFAAAGAVVLLPTLAYGAMFPLAARLADPRGRGPAVGRVYAFNTAGGVAGSLAAGFALLPLLGPRDALYLLAGVHLAAAAWVPARMTGRRKAWLLAPLAAALALAAAAPEPVARILRARLSARAAGEIALHREGVGSSVTVWRDSLGNSSLLINGILTSGKGELGALMAHLPLALTAKPRRALVIGLGAGNTWRAAVDHGVEADAAELEPSVREAFKILWADHDAYLSHPRAHLLFNDGRSALLGARHAYDAIILDATPPLFSAGSVNLYTREFLRLARARLAPGGVLALWVPLPCFEVDLWRIVSAASSAFPHLAAWVQPKTPGVLLLASSDALVFDGRLLEKRARERGLGGIPWLKAGQIAANRIVPQRVLRGFAAGVEPVTDDRPFTEFPLPLFWGDARRLSTTDDLIPILVAGPRKKVL